ncbi:hypothetical protein GQF03_16220 [Sneathiella chungangensis]|uniref:Uncharacterized protein n=1 Tax=Sneathiella chungangensis TaxID=1418234 RepID=A0A845MIL3_9PROT|nr:DUF4286 family protein [Sneathiella chungangensis]MZR23883.1 hypothetical protein [Sneathiella chungangensis]
MSDSRSLPAELFIATDIDPLFEDDFNRWYDREHMEERCAIPGFQWARRYKSIAGNGPQYLAIYRARSIDVFTSEKYREAFSNQTDWSLQSFSRMINTNRRVMNVPFDQGFGVASFAALIRFPASRLDMSFCFDDVANVLKIDNVLRIHCLEPDPKLSTPLPSEEIKNRKLEVVFIIDATNYAALQNVIQFFSETLGLDPNGHQIFHLIWELRSEDID